MKQYKDTRYYVDFVGNVYTNGKKLKSRHAKGGYKQINLYVDGRRITKQIHRLVAETYLPNPENKPQVNHRDGNKDNNWLGNLEWNTPLENVEHSIRTGLRDTKGENNFGSKLTEKEVKEIRDKFVPRQYTYKMLAQEYNVSQMTIYRIISNTSWYYI
jgi:hypothetical protein